MIKKCANCLAIIPGANHGHYCAKCSGKYSPPSTLEERLSRNPLAAQIGGDHYRTCKIQPVEFIEANGLAFLEGCVVKRVTRHGKEGGKGRQDIEKAIHELQLLLELRYSNG